MTNEDRLRELRSALAARAADNKPPRYFQVLLTTTVENSVPGKVSFYQRPRGSGVAG